MARRQRRQRKTSPRASQHVTTVQEGLGVTHEHPPQGGPGIIAATYFERGALHIYAMRTNNFSCRSHRHKEWLKARVPPASSRPCAGDPDLEGASHTDRDGRDKARP
ncbi:hypothetical protein CHELA20_10079 [Hyphomicrobiales bacterium]|nr:hypothetical protein CHELA20_10079 [Hyphomicrobiales bacterium]CAH1690413.1 hypothetical protein CHELA41_50305 [Hyphomicrobiales bacterium]